MAKNAVLGMGGKSGFDTQLRIVPQHDVVTDESISTNAQRKQVQA